MEEEAAVAAALTAAAAVTDSQYLYGEAARWDSKGYKPFGGVQRQSLWWGVGQSPTTKRKAVKPAKRSFTDTLALLPSACPTK